MREECLFDWYQGDSLAMKLRVSVLLLAALSGLVAVGCSAGSDSPPTSTPEAPGIIETIRPTIEAMVIEVLIATDASPEEREAMGLIVRSPSPNIELGERTFTQNCAACHSTTTQVVVGPGLAGLRDRAGSAVAGLPASKYIRQSITDPAAYITEGFSPIMPTFSQLDELEIDSLVTYLFTLE